MLFNEVKKKNFGQSLLAGSNENKQYQIVSELFFYAFELLVCPSPVEFPSRRSDGAFAEGREVVEKNVHGWNKGSAAELARISGLNF